MREAGYFSVEKMHLLMLDSFTPRGQKSIAEIPSSQRCIYIEYAGPFRQDGASADNQTEGGDRVVSGLY